MKKINVSEGKINYSQRNNEINPHGSCNTTSIVMALCYLGYNFPAGKYAQPEDNLTDFITTDSRCIVERNKFVAANPWAKGIPSVQIHDLLACCTNIWLGKKVVTFAWNRKIFEILAQLEDKRPVVLSGTFPGFPTVMPEPYGHIVTAVGAIWESDNGSSSVQPTHIIIDDPYGNTLDNWKGSGNDIEIPWDIFIKWFREPGDKNIKWGHFFKKPSEV